MNLLILGIGGFIGRAVAAHCVARGGQVIGTGRTKTIDLPSPIRYVSIDRHNLADLRHLVLTEKISAVLDVIPMTLEDTQPLLDTLSGLINHYVMISSCDVYANYALLQKTAPGVPVTSFVAEGGQLRTTHFPYRLAEPRPATAPDAYLDNYDKIPIEHAAQAFAGDWTILRLPMVYGPGDKQHRFRWAIAPMLKGEHRLELPSNWAAWESTYGYIDNVAAAISLALTHRKAKNRIFNLAETNPVTQLGWAHRFAEIIGWSGTITTSNQETSALAQSLAGLDLSVPLKISDARMRRELGFSEPVNARDALRATLHSEQPRES